MLMTKYIYLVHTDERGYLHTVVTRLSDGAQKYFFQAHGSQAGVESFMNSMTDELVEGYFPKPNKRGGGPPVDNWAFLGDNPARAVAEEQARIDFTRAKLS